MTLKLAWRNMWRNRRRTLIIGNSILFSALLCILALSNIDGSCNYMIDMVVEQQTGTFQIQNPDYFEDKRTDNFMFADAAQLNKWEKNPAVLRIAPRIETFAVAWNGSRTRNIMLQGVDPEREANFSKLNERIVNGEYFSEDDNTILIGNRMAEILKLSQGDTLTLISQGYHGESANGLFIVGGIVKIADPTLDAGVVYMPLRAAQEFISMPNGETYVAITLKNKDGRQRFDDNEYAYIGWQKLIDGTAAGAAEDKKQMLTYIYFLYLIVAFGVLSTVIMLVNERRREFGVMMALGTKRGTIFWSLFTEVLIIGMSAIAIAVAIALPVVAWLHYFPIRMNGAMGEQMLSMGFENILPFDMSAHLFYTQAIIVFAIVVLVMLYPLGKIYSMKVINAIKE